VIVVDRPYQSYILQDGTDFVAHWRECGDVKEISGMRYGDVDSLNLGGRIYSVSIASFPRAPFTICHRSLPVVSYSDDIKKNSMLN
jgi:hypothetical protein